MAHSGFRMLDDADGVNVGSGATLLQVQDCYKSDSNNYLVLSSNQHNKGFGKTESSRFHEDGSKNMRAGASLTASS